MLTNAAITAWSKRTASNSHGEPVFTTQPGGPWKCLARARQVKLIIGNREIVSTLRVHLDRNPGIAASDRLTVGGAAYTVLLVEQVSHATLGHETLLLGPP